MKSKERQVTGSRLARINIQLPSQSVARRDRPTWRTGLLGGRPATDDPSGGFARERDDEDRLVQRSRRQHFSLVTPPNSANRIPAGRGNIGRWPTRHSKARAFARSWACPAAI